MSVSEPISIETRAFELRIAEDEVAEAAAEYLDARAGKTYAPVAKAGEKLDVVLGNLKRAQRRYDRTAARNDS